MKNSDRVRPNDVRGLRTFVAEYPACRPMLLYRGPDRLEVSGIPCWPVEDFLTQLRPGQDAVPRRDR